MDVSKLNHIARRIERSHPNDDFGVHIQPGPIWRLEGDQDSLSLAEGLGEQQPISNNLATARSLNFGCHDIQYSGRLLVALGCSHQGRSKEPPWNQGFI